MNVAIENTTCIVKKDAIGETIISNICTGQTSVIAWQAGDWLMFAAASSLSLLMVASVLALLGLVGHMIWDEFIRR